MGPYILFDALAWGMVMQNIQLKKMVASRPHRFNLAAAFVVALAMVAWPQVALAHPHVWVNYWVKVLSSKEGITALEFTWRFDAMFSDLVKEELGLKTIAEKDSALVKGRAFDNLKNFNFFMDIKTDGKAFVPPDVSGFKVSEQSSKIGAEEGGGKGKGLVYIFSVKLPHPVREVNFSLFDPEFYVDIEPPMQELKMAKPGIMAVAKMEPKEFVSVAVVDGGVKGAVAPVCAVKEGVPRNSVWGEFPVFVVACKSE